MLGEPCKACGSPVDLPKSRLCRKCFNVYQKARPGYQKRLQEKAWYTYSKTCEACGAAYKAYDKTSRLCPVCYARQIELKIASATRHQYKQLWINNRVVLEHRYLAEQLFGRKPTPDEDIHHLNEDPRHNDLCNLIVLSHSNHARLHKYLEVQQVIEEKQGNPRPWYEIVGMLSLLWLRDNNIPYLRLSDLKASKDNLIAELGVSGHLDALYPILDARIHEALYVDMDETAKEHSEDP